MKAREYVPIKGLGTGRAAFQVATRHKLLQATDHLLLVQSTGFTEDYRRVYFRDIGTVIVRRTQRREWISLILALMAGAVLFLRLANVNWTAVLLGTIPFLIALVINVARGPACQCHVTTRVQTMPLPTPRRMAKVPLLIEYLREKTLESAAADAIPLPPS
jgi:hypothetical protein